MATIDTPPRSQYNRNLSFVLKGGGSDVSITLPIKPSEFEIGAPARVTTTQTLQGVYQDFGGMGVQTIRYHGNTGWRRRVLSNNLDGFEVFKRLYKDFYMEYHRRISGISNPQSIQVLIIDDLYDEVYVVSLDDFQGTKNKSSPLLYSYTISMTVQNTQANGRKTVDLTDISMPSVGLNKNQIPIAFGALLGIVKTWDKTQFRQYKVVKGDNLDKISKAYFNTTSRAKDIAQLNGIASPYIFNPGKILSIPW
jgi:hypothetical protein